MTEPTQQPAIAPPNGKDPPLYKVLYDKEVRDSERHTAVMEALNDIGGRLDAHMADGHPFKSEAEIAVKELERDIEAEKKGSKQADLMSRGLAVLAALIGMIGLFKDRIPTP